jgi:O-antigen ligase
LVIPLLPALPVVALAAALAAVSSGVDPELFLTRPDDTSPASRRELIWLAAVDELSSYNAAHVVGFGAYGNHVSGIAKHYDELFNLLATPGLTTLHSAVFQYIFDIGYLGLALFVGMLFVVVKRLGSGVSKGSNWEKASLGVFFFFLLMGVTESVPTIYFAESFFIFILISTSILLRDMDPRDGAPSATTPT